MTPTVGSLFAGIGGFDIGLASVGYKTSWAAEWAEFPRSVLRKRFPDLTLYEDVRDLKNPPKVDVLTGGFPCQDLSMAGRGAGIGGARSGLWGEYARIIGEVQPRAVIIENVPALLIRGFEVVVGDLVAMGYSIEWDCIPAAALGAPHLRDRFWGVAHREPAPVVFGQPMALFPITPEGAADLEEPDELWDGYVDEEGNSLKPEKKWHRWPRAGWVSGDAGLVMPLEPLARVADAKRRRVMLPTPVVGGVDRGAGGGVLHHHVNHVLDGELLPTPVANDVKGDVVSHLRNKNGWDGANRNRITSLAVLARNGFQDATDEQIAEAQRTAAKTDRAREAGWTPEDPALPTPRATDGDRGGRGDLLAVVKGRPNAHSGGEDELLPTPVASDAKSSARTTTNDGEGPATGRKVGDGDDTLLDAVRKGRLLPTPEASDGSGGRVSKDLGGKRPSGAKRAVTLGTAVAHGLVPTPTTQDAKNNASPSQQRRNTPPLNVVAHDLELMPTPAAADGSRGPDFARNGRDGAEGRAGSGGDDLVTSVARRQPGALNPTWVEWLMAFPLYWTDLRVENVDLIYWAWDAGEPPDVPRVSEDKTHRKERLTALGNGLVQPIPAWIGARLLVIFDPEPSHA